MTDEYWMNLHIDATKDRAARQKELDDKWQEHLRTSGRRRKSMIVRRKMKRNRG